MLLVRRILRTHPHLLHNPDASVEGQSNSSLHLAAQLGRAEIASLLISLGHEQPSPALNEQQQTALMIAAREGHTEIVHEYCEHVDRSALLRRDIRGRDAIMEAALGGHDTVLQILLTYVPGGAREAVQRCDLDGNTALHFASSNGNLLVLRTLLAAGADADRRNIWSWTAVAYSATVQAEVYLKGLIAEVERRRQQQAAQMAQLRDREDAEGQGGGGSSSGQALVPGSRAKRKESASVRMVEDDESQDGPPASGRKDYT